MWKLVFLIFVLLFIPYGFADWELVYETDFSEDPNWTTNIPGNYYWDSENKWFVIKIANKPPSWVHKSINYNGESFILKYDIYAKSIPIDTHINFGVSSNYSKSQDNRPEQFARLEFGMSGSYELGLETHRGDTRRFLYDVGKWYNLTLIYDNYSKNLTGMVFDKNNIVMNITIPGIQFNSSIKFLKSGDDRYHDGSFSEGYLDNLKFYLWSDEPLVPLPLDVALKSVVADQYRWSFGFAVNKNVTLGTGDIRVFVDEYEIEDFVLNVEEDGWRAEFDNPKIVGNLTGKVVVSVGNESAAGEKNFVYKIRHSHVTLVAEDFWDLLYASVANKTVALPGEETDGVVFGVGVDGTYRIKRNFIGEQWPGDGWVVVDRDKEKALLGAAVAVKLNYRLTNRSDVAGMKICTFNCVGGEILDTREKLETRLLKLMQSDYLALVNVDRDIGGLVPLLTKKRNAFPIAFSMGQNKNITDFSAVKDAINKTVEKLVQNPTQDYMYDPMIYIALLGMPYGVVEDPSNEIYYNVDGEFLYTDNFYADYDEDPYVDAAVGRITTPRQLGEIKQKDGIIVAEYRVPAYVDLILPGGMIEGFIVEKVLNEYGFDLKRIVEHRGGDPKKYMLKILADEFDFGNIKGTWMKLITQLSKPLSFIFWGAEAKYMFLETDLEKNIFRPKKLTKLTKTNLKKELPGEDIIFYFGIGNTTHWMLPKHGLNPYKTPIHLDEMKLEKNVFMYDEHSLSGHPDSVFSNQFLFVGSTGIVHNPFGLLVIRVFLDALTKNKPVGYAVRDMKTMVVFPGNETGPENLITGSTVTGALNKMKKEHYEKILYGDPKYVVDPAPEDLEQVDITDKQEVIFSLKPEANFTDADGWLMEYNKPVVPFYKFSLPLPKEAELENLHINDVWRNETVNITLVEPDEHFDKKAFNGTFPDQRLWMNIDRKEDGRGVLDIWVVGMQIHNSTPIATILEEINVTVDYNAPVDILSFDSQEWWDIAELKLRLKGNGWVNVSVLINGTEMSKRIYVDGFANTSFYYKGAAGVAKVYAGSVARQTYVNTRAFVGMVVNSTSKTMIKTFSETIEFTANGIRYWSPDSYLKLGAVNVFQTNDAKLVITTNATSAVYNLTTPYGRMVRKLQDGVADEEFDGFKVKEIMDRTIGKLGEKLRLIKLIWEGYG
jgi:hypothetical protein